MTEIDSKTPGMVGWIVQGLGLSMPQPALKNKEGCLEDGKVVQNAGSARSAPGDLVLEEVDSEDEAQEKYTCPTANSLPNSQPQSQPQTPWSPEQSLPLSVTTPSQAHIELEDAETQTIWRKALCILQDPCDMVLEEVDSDWEAQQREQGPGQEGSSLLQALPSILPHVLAMQEQEDAETQTERWTPLIESIKKEAEETAIANIEERLQLERVEAARMAEDLARQAAELAVRQLEEEHTTQIVIDTKPEEPDDEEQSLVDVCPAEPSPQESEVSDQAPQSPPPQPVTAQPQRASLPPEADQEEEPAEEGCGAPASCTGVKSWILCIPPASACLSSLNLLKSSNVPLPKMPSDLLLLYQGMSQLPKQANECFQNVLHRLNILKPM
ncbi:fibrous sheath CABYR-binding protein-like [Puntigrus tetrazona]|uniref:fibrous sheath CABYR-binding protein-like n=1 Tax=Puntigrus tetrazona TaxID=1606681 RepID=UPI001C8A366E|nr:fibrous sheath CABYR-binding protein-like [Puntigrus tetrazona]